MKIIFFSVLFFLVSVVSFGQELNGRISVVTSRVDNSVNKKAFQTLQTALTNFINNRKWTADQFGPKEKIDCNFLFNLESTGEANVYKGSLTIQSSRPAYNSTYQSPLINFQDNDLTFKYAEFQQLDFNDARVAGPDPLVSNLTAVIAYYVNLILGFDYDSFSPRGGNVYFQKAENIMNNAPAGRNISGWKAFDGTRNRYWLAENLMNSRYTIVHDFIYGYHRLGLDKLYDEEINARTQILNLLNSLNTYNVDNPNTMILQFIMQAKSQELIRIFSKASPQEKLRALEFLQKLDVSNASQYKDAFK